MNSFTESPPPPAKATIRNEPYFELMESSIERESRTGSPQFQTPEEQRSKSPADPIPSTEHDPAAMPALKKKGTGVLKKKGPKRRPPVSSIKRLSKKFKANTGSPMISETGSDGEDNDEEGEESGEGVEDEGPYCLCRGPDDHTWMIGCEICQDWFHGRCIGMSKEIGDNLVERFICPNCSKGELRTIFKKVCAYKSCRKPARLREDPSSVFCSDEHGQSWWEKTVGRMPRPKHSRRLSQGQLMQDEFMALLGSGIGRVDESGKWKLNKIPFSGDSMSEAKDGDNALLAILSEEEKRFLEQATDLRSQLKEETHLCQQMLNVVDFAQQRRRVAITLGRFGNDSCGYDTRLDTVSAKDAFAAFIKLPEGQRILDESKLSDPTGKGDEVKGMCEKKRCKVHRDWQKILPLGIKYRVREISAREGEVEEEAKIVKEAAEERWRRRKAENNWVERIDDGAGDINAEA